MSLGESDAVTTMLESVACEVAAIVTRPADACKTDMRLALHAVRDGRFLLCEGSRLARTHQSRIMAGYRIETGRNAFVIQISSSR